MPGFLSIKLSTLAALAVFAIFHVGMWMKSLWGKSSGIMPSWLELATGMVTNFFDTLGISSFATTTSVFRFTRMVPDQLIPGTLKCGTLGGAVTATQSTAWSVPERG